VRLPKSSGIPRDRFFYDHIRRLSASPKGGKGVSFFSFFFSASGFHGRSGSVPLAASFSRRHPPCAGGFFLDWCMRLGPGQLFAGSLCHVWRCPCSSTKPPCTHGLVSGVLSRSFFVVFFLTTGPVQPTCLHFRKPYVPCLWHFPVQSSIRHWTELSRSPLPLGFSRPFPDGSIVAYSPVPVFVFVCFGRSLRVPPPSPANKWTLGFFS